MFQMFPINAEVEASSPDRCRTCAVVGNSMNLKNSHYGPLIDFQDFVIRYVERDTGTSMNVFFHPQSQKLKVKIHDPVFPINYM